MPKKLLKMISYLLVLSILPLILAGVASAMFIAVHLAGGESFSAGLLALVAWYKNILPALPYITGIPAVLVVMALIFRNPIRITRWFRKES